jgi:hypothetical protein
MPRALANVAARSSVSVSDIANTPTPRAVSRYRRTQKKIHQAII